jgi:sulfofructose kinase
LRFSCERFITGNKLTPDFRFLQYDHRVNIKKLKNPSDTFDLQFPDRQPFDVVGFGTNSVDHLCIVPQYPPVDSKTEILRYEKLAGGQVATAITFLARLGLKTRYIGKVGDDELGRFLIQSFESESVDISGVLAKPNVDNQVAVIIIDKKSGERTVLSRRGSGLDFGTSELKHDQICSGRILHLDGYDVAGSIAAAAWCNTWGIPVSIDLDKAIDRGDELIKNIDFLIVSKNYPVEFTGIPDPLKAFEELRNCYDGFLAMTLGAAGALAWVNDRCVSFPALKVNAIDTTGAGDIFHGGFIYGLLRNWPLEQIMRFANAAAGLSCGYLGARAGIRTLQEIMVRAETLG